MSARIFLDVLPLVEFTLENDISDEEASRLIGTSVKKQSSTDKEWQTSTTQTLTIDTGGEEDDMFTARLLAFEVSQREVYIHEI